MISGNKSASKEMQQGRGNKANSIQLLDYVQLFATPWTAVYQASLSITNSQSLPKLRSIESVMPSNHLILCRPLLILPSFFPSIKVFSNESALCIRWPKYWSFSYNISPSHEHPGLISFRMDWLDLLAFAVMSFVLKPSCWERRRAGGEGANRTWDGWRASSTQWKWVWVNSGRWWRTGKPGVLQSMGSQRVRHDWTTELNWTVYLTFSNQSCSL